MRSTWVTRSSSWKCARLPSIQRTRVAQLAIGVGGGLEDFRADALVVPIIARRHPHAQDIGAGLLDHVLRRDGVAERLRHLAAVLVEREAVGDDDVKGRAAARAAGFHQRGMEPAAVLVGAFQIHHRVAAAVDLALDAGELREMHRVFQHEGVGGAGIEPDVENVVDLLPVLVGALARGSARARPARTRRRRPLSRRPRRCARRLRGPAGYRPSRRAFP